MKTSFSNHSFIAGKQSLFSSERQVITDEEYSNLSTICVNSKTQQIGKNVILIQFSFCGQKEEKQSIRQIKTFYAKLLFNIQLQRKNIFRYPSVKQNPEYSQRKYIFFINNLDFFGHKFQLIFIVSVYVRHICATLASHRSRAQLPME